LEMKVQLSKFLLVKNFILFYSYFFKKNLNFFISSSD
jgi:hypothetical protein